MKIVSKLVKIKAEFPLDNEYIEKMLLEKGIEPLRWAIVNVDCDILTISVACQNL